MQFAYLDIPLLFLSFIKESNQQSDPFQSTLRHQEIREMQLSLKNLEMIQTIINFSILTESKLGKQYSDMNFKEIRTITNFFLS